MSEASERTLVLLQELAVLKEEGRSKKTGSKGRKRRKEIGEEIKKIADEKRERD